MKFTQFKFIIIIFFNSSINVRITKLRNSWIYNIIYTSVLYHVFPDINLFRILDTSAVIYVS